MAVAIPSYTFTLSKTIVNLSETENKGRSDDIAAQTDSRNWPAADRPRARRTSADGRERAGRRLGTFPNRPARTAQRPGRRRRTAQRIQRVLDGLCEWLVPIACLDLHLGPRTAPPNRYHAHPLRAYQTEGCKCRAYVAAA